MMRLHKKVKTNPSSYQNKDSKEFDDHLLVTLKKIETIKYFFLPFPTEKKN